MNLHISLQKAFEAAYEYDYALKKQKHKV